MSGLVITESPAEEPLRLDQAADHCRVSGSDDNAVLDMFIVAARRQAETLTGRALITQKWKQTLNAFPKAAIAIERPPLQSVQSIKYYDASGNLQTLDQSAYTVHAGGIIGLVAPAYGTTWPAAQDRIDAIEIAFTAGYGQAAAVPNEIRQWMLLMIGTWYDNRSAVAGLKYEDMPRGMWDSLLDGYKVTRF